MALWMKKEDGTLVEVSGGGGGTFDGEHVPTGDPTDPATLDIVDEGQLLFDGVEGGGDGSAGGSIQYHSIGTSGVTGIEATEVDLPIVDVYGGPLVVGQKYAVSSEGSFRFGVGATSFVKQTVNINGSPAVECLAYKTFIDNERFMVSASRSWNCDDANPTVTVVASCSAGSMQTFNAGVRRANVTFTPMQSSGGGGGDAGPHDHDYLPLSGGTLTGDLTVDGTVATSNPGSEGAPAFTSTLYPTTGMYTHAEGVFFAVDGHWRFGAWADRVGIRHDLRVDGQTLAQSGTAALPGIAFTSSAWSGFYYDASTIHTSVQGQSRLQVGVAGTKVTGDLQVDGQVSFGVTSAGDWPLKLYDGSPTYFHGIGVGVNSLTFHVGESLAAELGPGGWAFGITEGIDTRDVLERAETATMPAPEEAGVDGLTVNEVVTALLLKVKELSADIKELKGN